MIRILLTGTPASRILCLTFTKAAAAEMRNRLSAQLGRWAMSDDKALDLVIAKLIDRPPEPEERTVARRLFARVLDAPGGINILTIHAFCQALLKRFPLEAGVAPGFEVMDETDATHLLRQAQDDQIEALAGPDAPSELNEALTLVAGKVSVGEYTELMSALLRERAWLLSRLGNEKGLLRVRRQLLKRLGCERAPAIDEQGLRAAARAQKPLAHFGEFREARIECEAVARQRDRRRYQFRRRMFLSLVYRLHQYRRRRRRNIESECRLIQ